MNKILLLLLSLSSIVLACHNSCSQCDVNVCLACNTPHAVIEPHLRACVCDQGYYAESINPLICKERLVGNPPDECEKEIAVNMANLDVLTLCYYKTEINNGKEENFVISDISIDDDHSQLSGQCRQNLVTHIQYRPKLNNSGNEDIDYIELPNPGEVTDLPGGKVGDKRIRIPLIEIYQIAFFQKISNDLSQIIQDVYFRILIGFTRRYVRSHRWIMTVFTNRSQVQTFVIDVDIQRTESCQDGQECIIIADLDVTGDQYKSDYVQVRGHLYTVGDWMYMRIWFKDSSYTKQLSFQKLFFKNDVGQIFDHTSLTDATETKWNLADHSLHVKLKLIEPGQGSVIQVNMKIETADGRLRRLQDDQLNVKKQFSATIFSKLPTDSANEGDNESNKSKAYSGLLFFGLLNLLALII